MFTPAIPLKRAHVRNFLLPFHLKRADVHKKDPANPVEGANLQLYQAIEGAKDANLLK